MFKENQLIKVTRDGKRITVKIMEVAKDHLWVTDINDEDYSFPINEWDIQYHNVEIIE